eukprot:jgi/Chrzof1/5575/Cz16g07320.t1
MATGITTLMLFKNGHKQQQVTGQQPAVQPLPAAFLPANDSNLSYMVSVHDHQHVHQQQQPSGASCHQHHRQPTHVTNNSTVAITELSQADRQALAPCSHTAPVGSPAGSRMSFHISASTVSNAVPNAEHTNAAFIQNLPAVTQDTDPTYDHHAIEPDVSCTSDTSSLISSDQLAMQVSQWPYTCLVLPKVCIDQGTYVLYDPLHDPRQHGEIPVFPLGDIEPNLHGFGDAHGAHIGYPDPIIRPATAGEETSDLQRPNFSECTIPVVFYPSYLYVFGEFLMRMVTPIWAAQQVGLWHMYSIMIATMGMQLESYHRTFLQPFSQHAVVTLSHASSRQAISNTAKQHRPDQQHMARCFRHLIMCHDDRQINGVRASNHTFGLDQPHWRAAQHVLHYYQPHLPTLKHHSKFSKLLAADALRVVIAGRPNGDLRSILNLEELLDFCNGWVPPRHRETGEKTHHRTVCVSHDFGDHKVGGFRYHALELAVLQHTDVLIGLHGSQLNNAVFMPRYSSVIEVRPYEFAGGWPDMYHQTVFVTEEAGGSIFWFGLDVTNASNSQPGSWEAQQQGCDYCWARDRHTRIEPRAVSQLLEKIVWVGGDPDRYQEVVQRQQHQLLSDELRHV